MSLITELRCQSFDEVVGNEFTKGILKKIIANPDGMPRNLIFSGFYGCAKTTLARIFAKQLNKGCDNPEKYLIEIDSSNVAKVEDMKEVIPYISLPNLAGTFKVVIFDEAHLISKVAFSQLLKLIEENTKDIFFVFCTTEIHKLLPTIRSRSLTFYVEAMNKANMKQYLQNLPEEIFSKAYIEDEALLDTFFIHSRGHYRDLIQQIELLRVQGIDLYKENIIDYSKAFKDILAGSEEAKEKILNLPLVTIEDSWDFFMKNYEASNSLILNHLQYRDRLHTTTDWHLFFNIIGNKKEVATIVSRIRR